MKKEDTDQHHVAMKHVEWWFLFAIAIIIIITVFALTNAAPAPVRFFFWTVELSLALLIFLSAAVGAVIAISLGFMKQLRNRKGYKQQEKRIVEMNKEISVLKAQVVELEGKLKNAKMEKPASSSSSNAGESPDQSSKEETEAVLPDFLRSKSSD